MAIPIANVVSHWQHYFQNFNIAANDFYSKIQNIVSAQQMPNIKVARVNHKEGGMFSASREYLRVQHADLVFDICAAPYGKNFFISWWLYETESTMSALLKGTRVGGYLSARAEKRTFYQIDEETMFRECVHGCILAVLDELTKDKGFKLTDEERQVKPIAA